MKVAVLKAWSLLAGFTAARSNNLTLKLAQVSPFTTNFNHYCCASSNGMIAQRAVCEPSIDFERKIANLRFAFVDYTYWKLSWRQSLKSFVFSILCSLGFPESLSICCWPYWSLLKNWWDHSVWFANSNDQNALASLSLSWSFSAPIWGLPMSLGEYHQDLLHFCSHWLLRLEEWSISSSGFPSLLAEEARSQLLQSWAFWTDSFDEYSALF